MTWLLCLSAETHWPFAKTPTGTTRRPRCLPSRHLNSLLKWTVEINPGFLGIDGNYVVKVCSKTMDVVIPDLRVRDFI